MKRDLLTAQMHQARAERLVRAETAARTAEATIADLTERLTAAEAQLANAEDRARDIDIPGVLPESIYTIGTEIPPLPDGPIAVIDLAYGSVHLRHESNPLLWRKLEPGAVMWTETHDLLAEGGPYLALPEDAQGLLRCAYAYDQIDRALLSLAIAVERPESAWRREVDHKNVIDWATERIKHADEALRRAERTIRELTDERDYWQRTAREGEVAR